jgi:hypothetical protein
MNGDCMRISIDDAYVEALGWITYAFALLEWNAISCCARVEPKCVHTPGRAKSRKRTAGEIAEDLVTLANTTIEPLASHQLKRLSV